MYLAAVCSMAQVKAQHPGSHLCTAVQQLLRSCSVRGDCPYRYLALSRPFEDAGQLPNSPTQSLRIVSLPSSVLRWSVAGCISTKICRSQGRMMVTVIYFLLLSLSRSSVSLLSPELGHQTIVTGGSVTVVTSVPRMGSIFNPHHRDTGHCKSYWHIRTTKCQ